MTVLLECENEFSFMMIRGTVQKIQYNVCKCQHSAFAMLCLDAKLFPKHLFYV